MACKNPSSNESHQPKSDEVRAWSLGLDRLLQSRYGTALFRAFLQREHAEENLDFILKVDKYKNMDNLQKRQRMAWDLYRDYIAVGAKHELNLDSMSRKVTTLAMITPHLTTFDTARARIMNLLSNDAYMRFQSWEIYRELASKSLGTNDDNSNEPSMVVPLKPNFWAPRRRKSANNAEDTGAGAGGTNDIPLRELT